MYKITQIMNNSNNNLALTMNRMKPTDTTERVHNDSIFRTHLKAHSVKTTHNK